MADQPMPKPGGINVTPVARRLFVDMLDAREAKGIETYGTTLQTDNGRDPLLDALEEACDLWQYLTQALLERNALVSEIEQLKAEHARCTNLSNAEAARFVTEATQMRDLAEHAEAQNAELARRLSFVLCVRHQGRTLPRCAVCWSEDEQQQRRVVEGERDEARQALQQLMGTTS